MTEEIPVYDIDVFVKIVTEETVKGWFERFGFPEEYFETTMIDILEKTKSIVEEVAEQGWEVCGVDPARLGRDIAEGGVLEKVHQAHPEMGSITMDGMVNAGGHILLCSIKTVLIFLKQKQARS